MNKLWDKHTDWSLNTTIEAFETGDDLLLDQKLVRYDCFGTIAHAMGLQKIGILTIKELNTIQMGLKEILILQKKGKFQLQDGDEDVHTKIENFLTDKYGVVGKKVHTGRSRNDQVLTALRLYTKDQLFQIWNEALLLSYSFLTFAKKYEYIPMPGYTHMQKAMPSSLGMWASSFVESLLDDLLHLQVSYKLNDQSPLGSAAAYGVPLPLDRSYTASLLGFTKVQTNSLYCQNSRGKIGASILSSLLSFLQTINTFASDVLLFTTSEFHCFTISKELCTGSSIMPQKRNIDIAELLRSKVHLVKGNYVSMTGISSNLISGYNRDLQDTKKPLIESLQMTLDCLKVTNILLSGITPNTDVLEKACSDEIFATHKALALVNTGVSFREAYGKVNGERYLHSNIKKILKKSDHVGGTGNLGLTHYSKAIKKEIFRLKKEKNIYETAISHLFISL